MEWQPIETAPKDGTQIILLLTTGEISIAELVTARDGSAAWEVFHTDDEVFYLADRATHWMPLPASPEQNAAKA